MSPVSFSAAVGEMKAVISCSEIRASSAPGSGSRAAVGEDLAAVTRWKLQSGPSASQESSNVVNKKRRRVDSIALNMISADGTLSNCLHRAYNPMESGMNLVSHIKSPRIKVCNSCALL